MYWIYYCSIHLKWESWTGETINGAIRHDLWTFVPSNCIKSIFEKTGPNCILSFIVKKRSSNCLRYFLKKLFLHIVVTKTDFFQKFYIRIFSFIFFFFSFSYRIKLIAMVSTAKKAKFPYASKIETILLSMIIWSNFSTHFSISPSSWQTYLQNLEVRGKMGTWVNSEWVERDVKI